MECEPLAFTGYSFLVPLTATLHSFPSSPLSRLTNGELSAEYKMNDEGFLGCFISARSFWASPDGFLPHLRASHAQETGVRQEIVVRRETGKAGGGCFTKALLLQGFTLSRSHVAISAHKPVAVREAGADLAEMKFNILSNCQICKCLR